MRKFILIFLTITPILLFCRGAFAETTNSSLTFYIVSKQKIEGGRFVDTPDFPKLGYIAKKADLVVTNLQEVFQDTNRNIVIKPDKNGNTNWITPSDFPPELVVKLCPEDTRPFMDLTEKAIGKNMLVMLDGQPLTFWHGEARFPEGRLDFSCQNQTDLKKTEDKLKKLIR